MDEVNWVKWIDSGAVRVAWFIELGLGWFKVHANCNDVWSAVYVR